MSVIMHPTVTRDEVLRAAQAHYRAYLHLKAHLGRCTATEAPAHAQALRRAAGEIRDTSPSSGKQR